MRRFITEIKPESYGALKSITDELKENAGLKVRITGHTVSFDDDALNLDLSKKRTESVKNELAKTFGIDTARMETEGKGEGSPVAPNDTPMFFPVIILVVFPNHSNLSSNSPNTDKPVTILPLSENHPYPGINQLSENNSAITGISCA